MKKATTLVNKSQNVLAQNSSTISETCSMPMMNSRFILLKMDFKNISKRMYSSHKKMYVHKLADF